MAEDRFLSRWSRRKAKVRSGRAPLEEDRHKPVFPPAVSEDLERPVAVAADGETDEALDEAVDEERELTDEELDAKAEELGLPPIESLGEGSDFKGFMAKEVPARLRNRALRKLWVSNPVLANLDGLVDYGEDFTDAAMVVENMATAYRVGSGYKRPEEEAEEQVEDEVGNENGDVADIEKSEEDIAEDVADEAGEDGNDEASEQPVKIESDEGKLAEVDTPFSDTKSKAPAPRG